MVQGDELNLNLDELVDNFEDFNPEDYSGKYRTPLADGGIYYARVTDIARHLGQSKTPPSYNFKVALVVSKNPATFDGRNVVELKQNYLWVGDFVDGKLKLRKRYENGEEKTIMPVAFLQFVGAVGKDRLLVGEGNLNMSRAIGAVVKIEVEHEEYNGNVNARVKRWAPAEAHIRQEFSAEPTTVADPDDGDTFSL